MNIIQKPTPNFTKGRDGVSVKKIVIHWIGAGTPTSTINWFANPNSKVSAHYLVGGEIYQFVKEVDTAWHAGDWDTNTESIGIEHYATPDHDLEEADYLRSAQLIKDICQRHNLPVNKNTIIKHSDVKATQCPGSIDLEKLVGLAAGDECQQRVEELEEKLEDMRESRNDWRRKYGELQDDFETYEKSTREHIEEMQFSLSELNLANSSLEKDILTLVEEKKSILGHSEALEKELAVTTGLLEKTAKELTESLQRQKDLETDLEELKKKKYKKLSDFTWGERFLSLFGVGVK